MADACPVPDLDPFSRAFLEDPYPGHERPREAGPAVRLERYGACGLARHAEVQATLADWRNFCSSAGVGLNDFRKEPPWRLRGHLACGAGIHACVGQTMSRMEGAVVLGALARRVETLEPAGEPEHRLNNTLRGLASMPLAVRPRRG